MMGEDGTAGKDVMAGFPTAPGTMVNNVQHAAALPLRAVLLNPDGNPHAYQKRLALGPDGSRTPLWFCTTDSDWGASDADLFREHDSLLVLWVPPGR